MMTPLLSSGTCSELDYSEQKLADEESQETSPAVFLPNRFGKIAKLPARSLQNIKNHIFWI